jgi:hypothetical protein
MKAIADWPDTAHLPTGIARDSSMAKLLGELERKMSLMPGRGPKQRPQILKRCSERSVRLDNPGAPGKATPGEAGIYLEAGAPGRHVHQHAVDVCEPWAELRLWRVFPRARSASTIRSGKQCRVFSQGIASAAVLDLAISKPCGVVDGEHVPTGCDPTVPRPRRILPRLPVFCR